MGLDYRGAELDLRATHQVTHPHSQPPQLYCYIFAGDLLGGEEAWGGAGGGAGEEEEGHCTLHPGIAKGRVLHSSPRIGRDSLVSSKFQRVHLKIAHKEKSDKVICGAGPSLHYVVHFSVRV